MPFAVAPVVVRATKIVRVASSFSAHDAATMAADGQQHMDLTVFAAADNDGHPADGGRFAIARLGDLALMGDVHSRLLEDVGISALNICGCVYNRVCTLKSSGESTTKAA